LSSRDRILKSLGASGLSQLITAAIQLIGVPVLLFSWGKQVYGEWIVLTALPAYLTLSDLGFASVAANEMTMQVARGERKAALCVFQSTWVLISAASAAAMGCLVAVLPWLPLGAWLNLEQIAATEAVEVILLFALQVFLGLQIGLLCAGLRAVGEFALGVMYGNLGRVLEFILLAAIACGGGGPVLAAAAMLGGRAVTAGLSWRELRVRAPWIRWGWAEARGTELRRLARPAFAFMAFPLGHALNIQGIVIVISAMVSAPAAAAFSTMRTLSRLVVQLTTMVITSTWPEVSAAYGAGDMELARRLHRACCRVALWLVLPAVLVLGLFGGRLYACWVRGDLQFNATVFRLLLAVTLANVLWFASSVVPMAVNRHQGLAVLYLLGSGAALGLAVGLVPWLGLAGAALGLLAVDSAMIPYVLRKSLGLLDERFGGFMRSVIRLPQPRELLTLVPGSRLRS